MVQKTILPCGLTILSETSDHIPSIALSYTLKSGSREEFLETTGIHHLIEHMAFKGCDRYDLKRIADLGDRLGGGLNAFTAKEMTQFYLKAVDSSFDLAFDLLSRIVFKATFPADEYKKERNVVLQEIREGEDNPDTFAFETYFEQAFPGTGLGYPIGGKRRWLRQLSRDQVFHYYQATYIPENLILCAVGNITHDRLAAAAAAFFEGFPERPPSPVIFPEAPSRRFSAVKRNRTLNQYYVITGLEGVSQSSTRRYTFMVLNDILGSGMSSRLFQKIREEKGLAYSVSSFTESFLEQGLLMIYAAVEAEKFDDYLSALRAEIESLRAHGVTEEELARSKDHLLAATILSLETQSARMRFHTSNEIYFQEEQKLEEVIAAIRAISRDDISRLAAEFLDVDSASLFVYGNLPARRGRFLKI